MSDPFTRASLAPLSNAARSPAAVTVLVAAVLVAAAVSLDRVYGEWLEAQAAVDVQAQLEGHAFALERALAQREMVLEAVQSWIAAERGGTSPRFGVFARGLLEVADGVRAIQVVEGGVIARSYPEVGNRGVLGYDLLSHPDARVRDGLIRAWDSAAVTLTGPLPLIQGGLGIILRRSAGLPGDRSAPVAALVLDVGPLLTDAGLDDPGGLGLRLSITAQDGRVFHGEILSEEDAPVYAAVLLPEGTWSLHALPVGGWGAATAQDRRIFRGGAVLVVVLGTILIFIVVDREDHLTRQVAKRTRALSRSNRQLELAAAELRAKDEELTAALRAGRVTTWSWNVRTGEVWRNDATSSLLAVEGPIEATLDGILDRAHPDDREGLADALREAAAGGVISHEFRARLGTGRYVWLKAEGHAADRDEEGVVRVVGATTDISRIKQLEQEVLHGRRLELIGRLAGGVAHDFNNLLTVIVGEIELALDSASSEATRGSLQEALRAVEHAAVLTRQLLTFARKDVVRVDLFDFDEACSEALALIGRLVEERIVVEAAFGAAGARVRMDRGQAIQVLVNLAVNARDAMPGSGHLWLRTRVETGAAMDPSLPAEPFVVLEVEDTGAGIAPDALEHIFEPFFTTKGAGQGTGLGLATTARIVADVGGRVLVKSEVDRGTTFSVLVPRAD